MCSTLIGHYPENTWVLGWKIVRVHPLAQCVSPFRGTPLPIQTLLAATPSDQYPPAPLRQVKAGWFHCCATLNAAKQHINAYDWDASGPAYYGIVPCWAIPTPECPVWYGVTPNVTDNESKPDPPVLVTKHIWLIDPYPTFGDIPPASWGHPRHPKYPALLRWFYRDVLVHGCPAPLIYPYENPSRIRIQTEENAEIPRPFFK
jgi:hypothetical protein